MLSNQTVTRHIAVMLGAALLVYCFLVIHSKWAPIHRWNRAFADASMVLLAITMMIGPLVRMRAAWSRLVPWRRETGIHAISFATIHFLLVLDGWIEWDVARVIGLLAHPARGNYVMAEHGFGLANILGLAALVYGAILVSISNERAVRYLGGNVWKFIQRGAYALWALVVIHTVYFLFMHFLHYHRPLPDPNLLQWPFVGLVAFISALQIAAVGRTWWSYRKSLPVFSPNGRHGGTAPVD